MSDTIGMLRIRDKMRSTMREFKIQIKEKAKNATEFNRNRITGELNALTEKFAKEYSDLQSKYSELIFHQDLEEIVGKDKAELFLKVQAFRDAAKNN